MHELSVCQALIGQVERVARENDARSVVAITIAVGPLSGVEAGLLEHAYPSAAAGTLSPTSTALGSGSPFRWARLMCERPASMRPSPSSSCRSPIGC